MTDVVVRSLYVVSLRCGCLLVPYWRKAVTLPTPDAQSPRFLSKQTHSTTPAHPMHSIPTNPVPSFLPSSPLRPPGSETEFSALIARNRATHIATRSRNLATGGLKTLTAKRELPPKLERRATGQLADTPATSRSYTFLLVILACILVMLISGGIVLFMMLLPSGTP